MYFSDQVFVVGPNVLLRSSVCRWSEWMHPKTDLSKMLHFKKAKCTMSNVNNLCIWGATVWQVDKRPRVEHNDPSHPIAPRFDGVEV
jgi:hypothetical protein